MMKKVILFLSLLYSAWLSSQIVPATEASLKNFTAYSMEGTNPFGDELRKAFANTSVKVLEEGKVTNIRFTSSLIGNDVIDFVVTNAVKRIKPDYTTYEVQAFNAKDPSIIKKIEQIYLVYSGSQLKRFVIIRNDGAAEFY